MHILRVCAICRGCQCLRTSVIQFDSHSTSTLDEQSDAVAQTRFVCTSQTLKPWRPCDVSYIHVHFYRNFDLTFVWALVVSTKWDTSTACSTGFFIATANRSCQIQIWNFLLYELNSILHLCTNHDRFIFSILFDIEMAESRDARPQFHHICISHRNVKIKIYWNWQIYALKWMATGTNSLTSWMKSCDAPNRLWMLCRSKENDFVTFHNNNNSSCVVAWSNQWCRWCKIRWIIYLFFVILLLGVSFSFSF